MMGRNRNAGKPGAKNPGKTFKRIMAEIMGRYKPHCVAVVLCLIVSAVANVYGTMFMQRLIDDYITPMIGRPDPDFGPMGRAVLGVALVYFLGAFSAWLYNYLMIFVSQGTLKNLRVKLFSKMERLPIRYFDTHAHGDIMSVYTNDIDTMRQMISQSMPQLISSVVTIVSIVISMIILNVPLLIITLFMVATTMTLSVKRIKSAGRFFVAQQQDLGRVNGYIEEMMDGRCPPRERLQRQPHLQHHHAADDGDGQPELCALRGGRRPAGLRRLPRPDHRHAGLLPDAE